jgi:hypothetical protein
MTCTRDSGPTNEKENSQVYPALAQVRGDLFDLVSAADVVSLPMLILTLFR